MIAWQLESGDFSRAFEYSERRRARVLLDQLAAAQVDLRDSIPDEVRIPLLQKEDDARARLAESQQRISRLDSRKDLTEEERATERSRLQGQVNNAESDYQKVYEEIKNASPLWTQGVTSGGEAVSLETIQKELIPEKGMLLSFLIGVERSFLFSIPPLGGKPEVRALEITEELARNLGIEPGPLTAAILSQILMGADEDETSQGLLRSLSQSTPGSSRGIRMAESTELLRPEERLHDLWRLLLPERLWMRVAECSEIIVIPDGPLHWIPFETLVTKPGDTPSDTRYWLDEGPVVRYGPSATTLHNIAQRKSEAPSQAVRELVVSLSDPVYDPEEVKTLTASRTSLPESSPLPGVQSFPRKRYVSSGGTLARLPGTARESEAIEKAFGQKSDSSEVVAPRRLEATESNLRNAISDKRYIHLATHGLVEQGGNSLFASLALTAPTEEEPTTENDGFLQLFEIYDLKLPACELADLSACQTNVGKQVKGEGVFGLSRGFLVSGARRVVASQWNVDDESTAVLMGAFFEQIAEAERTGKAVDYSTALPDAKKKIRSNEKWADPFYWAPFILMGKE